MEKGFLFSGFIFLCANSTALWASTHTSYFYNDVLGSPILKVTELGDVASESQRYQPYGQSTPPPSDQLAFTGKLVDRETGLTYMNARYYDSRIGRFVSADPVSFLDGGAELFNRYAYANNNPYKYTDPTGETPLAVFAIARIVGQAAMNTGVSGVIFKRALKPKPASDWKAIDFISKGVDPSSSQLGQGGPAWRVVASASGKRAFISRLEVSSNSLLPALFRDMSKKLGSLDEIVIGDRAFNRGVSRVQNLSRKRHLRSAADEAIEGQGGKIDINFGSQLSLKRTHPKPKPWEL